MIINTSGFPEFELACDLLYIRPQEAIEAFMNNVSLPYLCGTERYLSERSDRPLLPIVDVTNDPKSGAGLGSSPARFIATNFLVTYCSLFSERLLPAQRVQKEFIKKFKPLKLKLRKEENEELRYFLLVEFYMDWHRALIENMSEHDAIIDVKSKRENFIQK